LIGLAIVQWANVSVWIDAVVSEFDKKENITELKINCTSKRHFSIYNVATAGIDKSVHIVDEVLRPFVIEFMFLVIECITHMFFGGTHEGDNREPGHEPSREPESESEDVRDSHTLLPPDTPAHVPQTASFPWLTFSVIVTIVLNIPLLVLSIVYVFGMQAEGSDIEKANDVGTICLNGVVLAGIAAGVVAGWRNVGEDNFENVVWF